MTRILYTGETGASTWDLYVSNGPGQATDIATNVYYPGLLVVGGKVLFQNIARDGTHLSATNGYAAGTTQIFPTHVFPGAIAFGNNALFEAEDSTRNTVIWITDLANNTAREISTQGSLSDAFIVGKYAYFSGADSSGNQGIFRTDGTTTVEIVSGSAAHPPRADPVGKTVVFWEWDAAAAGYELVSDLGAVLLSASQADFYPTTGIAVGNEIIFEVDATNGDNSLWATDGTTAEEIPSDGGVDAVFGNRAVIIGSHGPGVWNGFSLVTPSFLLGVRGEGVMVGDYLFFNGYNSSAHDNAPTLCVMNVVTGAITEYPSFTGYNGPGPFILLGDKEVLFAGGLIAAGLWASDGPSAPVEIIGSNSPLPVEPTFFFALNDRQVLFVNYDGSLWVTDGTYGGSFQIESADQGNNTLAPTNFRDVGNGIVAFDSPDSNGYYGTWVTNGTAAGTYELGAFAGLTDIVTLPDQPQPADFKGSGNSDVLFRAGTSGDTGFYSIVNSANAGWVDIGASSTAYSVAGTGGDFNGDGMSDVLFRNGSSGDTGFYAIVNGVNAGWHDVGASSTAYGVMGTGDFNNDGTSDILYRNNSTGDTGFYAVVNGANTGWHDVGASSTAYAIAGVGDFNNDGTSDILYRNGTTGDTGFYAIVNGVNTGWNDVGVSSTAYSIVGVGDFNGDGTSDILYRNNSNGDTGFYEIAAGVNTGWHHVGASSTAYSVVGVGDFNGDGTSDILYRNDSTGDTGFYAIVAGVNTGWHDIGASSTAYRVTG